MQHLEVVEQVWYKNFVHSPLCDNLAAKMKFSMMMMQSW